MLNTQLAVVNAQQLITKINENVRRLGLHPVQVYADVVVFREMRT